MNSSNYPNLIHGKPGAKPSITRRILEHLLEGGEVSVLSGIRDFHTTEVRAVIAKIRRLGIPIVDKWQTLPGSKKRHKIYFIAA